MVIVRLWGGIGNQLFQYVFGQYIRYKYNEVVKYDDNAFNSSKQLRKRELDNLTISVEYDNHCTFSKYYGFKGKLLRYIYQLNPKHHFIGLHGIIPSTIREDEDYFFQGYWQDYKYYEWLVKNVPGFHINLKTFPNELSEYRDMIQKTANSVSLHVRRGDYFKPQFISTYGVCSEAYYQEAIKRIKNKIPEVRLFVFSDDLEWVKNHIELDADAVLISNYDISQFAYIELMSMCKHHIISNSSFSWWGAVINESPNAYVISPQRWLLTTEKTIALGKWEKI